MWHTADEIYFIDRLGSLRIACNLSRKELLERYVRAASIRSTWEKVDKGTVIHYAREQLKFLQGGSS